MVIMKYSEALHLVGLIFVSLPSVTLSKRDL